MLTDATISHAREAFDTSGGIMRTKDAIAAGIHPRTLYAMRDSGHLELVVRGIYRLAHSTPMAATDLVAASLKIPKGIICLNSALALHKLIPLTPRAVHLTVPRNARTPRLDIPIRIYRATGEAYTKGVQVLEIDGVELKVYSPEKTIADCFKYRSRVGLRTALEVMLSSQGKKELDSKEVLHFARLCRVEKIIRPFLKAGDEQPDLPSTEEPLPYDYKRLAELMPPQAIRDDAQNANVLQMVDNLMKIPEHTPDQKSYLETLVQLVEAYESKHHNIEVATPPHQ